MRPALQFLFFLSGFTGLVYEVAWSKMLALTLGGTAAAQTFVLAAFLGGLAAGYALLGRAADRSRSPLLLYAKLELGVAALGALAPWALGSVWGLALVPLAAGLMGGTLPALARRAAASVAQVGPAVARLYYLNSLGAAAGALCAAFALIPRLGLDGACLAAAALNALIGAWAWRMAAEDSPSPAVDDSGRGVEGAGPGMDEGGSPALFYAIACVSGVVSLALETAWVRLLSLAFGSSVYSFAGMLAAFIAGVGSGSWLVSRGRLPALPAARLLAFAQLGAALALLASLPFYERAVFLPVTLGAAIGRAPRLFLVFEAAKCALAFALMFVPAACFGMTPPLAARAAVRAAPELGRRVGAVFAWNAGGNVAGAALAGLWLLPALGLQGLFVAGAALQLALAAALFARDGGLPGRRAWALACAAVLAAYPLLAPAWDPMPLAFGGFRVRLPEGVGYADYRKNLERYRLRYHADGREATVSVIEFPDGNIALKVNGKTDASSALDLQTQILLAQLPLLLHENPQEALIIGLGSGITAGSALLHGLARLDLAEISPEVVAAERFFRPFNGNPLRDPRLRLFREDARTFLQRGDARYDAILSEPSNPWMAGVGALFTAEFYARARARLKPGGLMVQWFHVYEMDQRTLKLALRTFAASFPEVSAWHTYSGDVLLVGSERAPAPDFARLERRVAAPAVARELGRVRLSRTAELLALQMAGDATVRELGGAGALNRDRFPRLEYGAPRGFFLRRRAGLLFAREDAADPARRARLLLARYLRRRGRPLSPSEHAALDAYHDRHRWRLRRLLSADWRAAYPRDPGAYAAAARAEVDAGGPEAARRALREGLGRVPGAPALLELAAELAEEAFRREGSAADAEEAARALAALRAVPEADPVALDRRLAKLELARGDHAAALRLLRGAALAAERRAGRARSGGENAPDAVWMEYADLALDREDPRGVYEGLERALARNPENANARAMLDILLHDDAQVR